MVLRVAFLRALLAFSPLGCEFVVAQEAEPTQEESSRVERAIADYESLRDKPKEAARRQKALLWLGEIDDAAATDYLSRELANAGHGAGAVPVLDAIARVPRPSLHRELHDLLHANDATEPVRVAAARAIASFGERGIDHLLSLVFGPAQGTTGKARESTIGVLVDSDNDRALRSLAPMLLDGPMAERLKLLRRMEKVRGVFPIDAARIRLVSEATIDVAAVAWRQLAVHGHERARSLAIDMLERLVDEPKAAVAADLIGGIASVRDPDLYPVLLRFAGAGGEVVRRALRGAAPSVARDPALVTFLIERGIESDKPVVRDAARLLLADAPAAAFQPLLARVRAELRNGKKASLDLAVELHELLAKDPGWCNDLLALAGASDTTTRVTGLSLLLEIGADNAIVEAQKCLIHRAWELRSVAYRYLTKCRDVSSIPLLIARVEREDGRLAYELASALFAHTGTRCWKRAEWENWWAANKTGFALPHADTVRVGDGSGAGKTISYHGIPLVSERVAFLIDFSGSMLEKIGTDKKRSRLDEAKDQLTKVVTAVSDSHRLNLIWFFGEVHAVWDKLHRADAASRKELLDEMNKVTPGGGTNIFDALELAFRDGEVDTIYLLTDGEPTAGRFTATQDIVDEVRRWNRERQIVIHTISIGTNTELLRRLAADSGGVYKFVR